jgi:hypothetical protein
MEEILTTPVGEVSHHPCFRVQFHFPWLQGEDGLVKV